MNTSYKIGFLLAVLVPSQLVQAFTNPNLYYATPRTDACRAERKGLFSIDLWAVHGSTTDGRDNAGNATNVLGIYGVHKMHQIGRDVGGQTITDTNTGILAALWNVVPVDDTYAQLAYSARAVCATGAVDVNLNLTSEFFLGTSIPYYSLDIQNPRYTDLTSAAATNAQWTQFLGSFNQILALNGLTAEGGKESGLGDVALWGGWTKNNEDTDDLDFADLTIRVGGILGNAQKKDQDKAFTFASDYDGHKAIFADIGLSIGTNQVLTLDFAARFFGFLKRSLDIRMQTAQNQNGFIKLAKGRAERKLGSLYQLDASIAWEMIEPLSLVGGYTYTHKGSDSLTPENTTLFPSAIVNSDSMLAGWAHHVVHIGLDLDFANHERALHPHVILYYNRVVKARNAFLNHTVGGQAGLAVTWNF